MFEQEGKLTQKYLIFWGIIGDLTFVNLLCLKNLLKKYFFWQETWSCRPGFRETSEC